MATTRARSDWLLLPNILTMTRFVAAAALPIMFLVAPDGVARPAAFGLFVYAALTDFVDGWAARRLGQTSALGAAMDPLADKALLLSTMAALAMVDFADAPLFWVGAGLIALREIGVTVLRWRTPKSPALTVTLAAKWKTATQMTAVSALLAVGLVEGLAGAGPAQALWVVGVALFAVAVWLTVVTGWAYLKASQAALAGSER